MAQMILVTGGCGYVGCRLVPHLLERGHRIRVLDAMIFGNSMPKAAQASDALDIVEGDIRDDDVVRRTMEGCSAVIHLAALANDPSADMDPELAKSINRDAVISLVERARSSGVTRFINASTATVYGVREEPNVNEDFEHRPITLYGRYKSETDKYVAEMASKDFTTVSLRAATVCGWSPRMRLDLTVNILTMHAVTRGQITVHGGKQMRPNIVIDDLIEAYAALLEAPADRVNGRAYNVGGENYSVLEIAKIVAAAVSPNANVVVEPVVDQRSYHISSQRIRDELGFAPKFDIRHAAKRVAEALRDGRIADPGASIYQNLAHMKAQEFH